MNVRNLSDEDLIQYLSNNDIDYISHSSEEYKYLLKKCFDFYKREKLSSYNKQSTISRLEAKISKMVENAQIVNVLKSDEMNDIKIQLGNLKNRKLTFMERITGKIKFDKK